MKIMDSSKDLENHASDQEWYRGILRYFVSNRVNDIEFGLKDIKYIFALPESLEYLASLLESYHQFKMDDMGLIHIRNNPMFVEMALSGQKL